jgi:hypothetical protein
VCSILQVVEKVVEKVVYVGRPYAGEVSTDRRGWMVWPHRPNAKSVLIEATAGG